MSAAPNLDDDELATTVPCCPRRVSVAHSEAPRDTVVDPPSGWSRIRAFAGAVVRRISERFRKARLGDRLPPLPPPRSARATRLSAGAVGHDDHGELLLLAVMRADSAYQSAAIYVANYALALRKLGSDAYAEGLVHYALSRVRADADGFISFARLRDILCEMSVSGTLVPALLRLERAGIVAIKRSTSVEAAAPLPDRVQLRVPL